MVATAQHRSRENSLTEAKDAILERLNKSQSSKAYQEIAANRKQQVGSGERGDKMRTYRFQDNSVKDHRTEKQAKADKVLAGNFHLLW
jgi:peptide chain release factor 1